MQKGIKTAVALILVFTLIALFSVFCFASEPSDSDFETNRLTAIKDYYASISISGITASCNATLKAKYSTNLKIEMVLQKQTSSGYTNVTTWTATGTGTSLSLSKSKTINIFSNYRLKVTFKADNETCINYYY